MIAKIINRKDFDAQGFANVTFDAFKECKKKHLRSLVLDNGPEMKLSEVIENSLKWKVYHSTPYHSWQRGCNENANGLLRYFFPKRMYFNNLTQAELDRAVDLINNRPRKRLKWRTPKEMLKP